MSVQELDYDPEPAPTRTTIREVAPAARTPVVPKIKVSEFIADVLAGRSDAELLEKYELRPKQLEFVFQRLLDLGYLTVSALYDRGDSAATSISRAFVDVYQSLKELDD